MYDEYNAKNNISIMIRCNQLPNQPTKGKTMTKEYNINIDKFLEKFNEEYEFLYDSNDRVAGFDEAVEAGDEFIKEHNEFVIEFNRYRGDILTSDREVAAFMFALDDMID